MTDLLTERPELSHDHAAAVNALKQQWNSLSVSQKFRYKNCKLPDLRVEVKPSKRKLGYNNFVRKNYKLFEAKHPEFKSQHIMKEIGTVWKELSPEQKAEYENLQDEKHEGSSQKSNPTLERLKKMKPTPTARIWIKKRVKKYMKHLPNGLNAATEESHQAQGSTNMLKIMG